MDTTRYLLPCSPQVLCEDRFSILDTDEIHVPFWELFKVLASQTVKNPDAVIELLESIAIAQRQKTETDYGFLRNFMTTELPERFYTRTWPCLVSLALEMPTLFPEHSLPILSSNHPQLRLSRRQVACLVVHQFLCTLTAPSWQAGFQDFHIWYSSEQPHSNAVAAYLTALFTFFDRLSNKDAFSPLASDPADWPISYTLHSNEDPLPNTNRALSHLEVIHLAAASTAPEVLGLPSSAAVISANKFLGFGRTGTQEETHVGASSESCPAVLVTPPLQDTQVLVVTGPEAMVTIAGYGREAKCQQILRPSGDAMLHRCQWARRTMLFMDALELDLADRSAGLPDLQAGNVQRELRKAYTAFRSNNHLPVPFPFPFPFPPETTTAQPYSAIYTGLWGCGSFGGNAAIKTMVQWCAASLAGSELKILCSGPEQGGFGEGLGGFVEAVAGMGGVGTGELVRVLLELRPGCLWEVEGVGEGAWDYVLEELRQRQRQQRRE